MSPALSRRHLLTLGGAAAVAGPGLLAAGGSRAQAQITLRIGHVLSPSHPFHHGLALSSRRLAESTKDRIKLQVFPSPSSAPSAT